MKPALQILKRVRIPLFACLVASLVLSGCSSASPKSAQTSAPGQKHAGPSLGDGRSAVNASDGQPVYAHDHAGQLTGNMARAKPLIYVPNSLSNTVQVIDPTTFKVIRRFHVGRSPEHVVPNHDGSVLWVNSDLANSLTPINPMTGQPGPPVEVDDPYNLYFTPDGSEALVMSERLHLIVVRDARTMVVKRRIDVHCSGINHGDYTADMKFFVASCEFSGKLVVIPTDFTHIATTINLNAIHTPGATSPDEAHMMGGPKAALVPGASAMPQDVRLTPDGRYFLAADMLRNGVWVIDARTFHYVRFIRTGIGAHGIYPSRDTTRIYISNRDVGTVSVLDSATLAPVALWQIPGGGSPDMGGVSADGTQLWLSGRYNSEVYVFDTRTGQLVQRIKTQAGGSPHGMLVWPQPGRFSLGHTGNMR